MSSLALIREKNYSWLSCREKSCCHNTRVIISGKDMWRISQVLEIGPWDFTLYTEAEEDAVGGFLLSPDGPLYQVVLSKRGAIGPQGAPCIFLWKLGDGHAQCGLGELRPLVCQAYPALLVDNVLMTNSSSCTCRRWSTLDLHHDAETDRLNEMLREAAEYSEVVDEWNQSLLLHPNGSVERTYRDFCTHVLTAYEQRYRGPDAGT